MKLLSATQTRDWDEYTIRKEPINSLDLMERAAGKCVDWISDTSFTSQPFSVFCGKGNNGGDGLAIARMLAMRNCSVTVNILEFGHLGTDDFQQNLARLHQVPDVDIRFIQTEEHIPSLSPDTIVIDALLGSGLNRSLEGLTRSLVEHINHSECAVISIDIPSGLFTDRSSLGEVVVRAKHTLSFQGYKLAFMMAENAPYIGEVHILDIGLDPAFLDSVVSGYELIDEELVRSVYQPRNAFGHKGNFGHAMIVAGSFGKVGAGVLAAKACLRSGVGLLSCHIPGCGYGILQSTVPEAMAIADTNEKYITKIAPDTERFACVGIGPGIGTHDETKKGFISFISNSTSPLVIDADALNCLASDQVAMDNMPEDSILTPHPKEFERLFGPTANEFERIQRATLKAAELNCIIILKGHHSFIATPSGPGYFNNTGNVGMATGGSGDVLTGILTALRAQGYSSRDAAILGVYMHGLAGDMAADRLSKEAMIASDIIDHLSYAFLSLAT